MIHERERVSRALEAAVHEARENGEGHPAAYIPELATGSLEATSAAITFPDGTCLTAGDADTHRFTLQSAAKIVVLAGLLEERGLDAVRAVAGTEPSCGAFHSVALLETQGPRPANPLVNAGAIALCGMLQGEVEHRLAWLEGWMERLTGVRLPVNQRVLASERRTSDRNRAIAHLLRSNGILSGPVDAVLETYFALCSFECGVREASRVGAVLAGGGQAAGGRRILSADTSAQVVALMATCGMYDESGAYLLDTGLPAKSGVSGVIVAVAPGRAGLAVASPRVTEKGASIRGGIILRRLSRELGWHFALQGAAVAAD